MEDNISKQSKQKKKWQKPEIFLLDSVHDINAKNFSQLHESTVHRVFIPGYGPHWIKGSKTAANRSTAITNQSSAFS